MVGASELSGFLRALAGPRFGLHRPKSLSSQDARGVSDQIVCPLSSHFTGEETKARGGYGAFVKPLSPGDIWRFRLRPHVPMAPRFAF